MSYIITSILIIGYIAWLFGSILFMAESDGLKYKMAGLISVVLALAVLIWAYDKYDAKNQPCAIYKTRLEYNPALKMTMPMKYCAERGEWVKDA